MPVIDFREIPQANIANGNQDAFELFARDFFEHIYKLKVISSPNRGADGGKDILFEEAQKGLLSDNRTIWLVSCKHNAFSGKSVNEDEERNISDRLLQHGADGFIGFYSSLPSSGLNNRLDSYKSKYKIEIFDNMRIEQKIIGSNSLELFRRYFPISFNFWNETTSLLSLFVHDISQKVYVLSLHNNSFKRDIKKAMDESLFATKESVLKESEKELFFNSCMTYNRQMSRIEESLEYLKKMLENGSMSSSPKLETFLPHATILTSIMMQYDKPYFRHYNKYCRLYMLNESKEQMTADMTMVQRALLNIIDNAFKYAYDGTNIYLNYTYEGNLHVFRVTNYCSGIKEEIADSIFSRGTRGDINHSGNGLGLYIAREFAEYHGGTLELESGIIKQNDNNADEGLKMAYNFNLIEFYKNNAVVVRDKDKDSINKLIDSLSIVRDKISTQNSKNCKYINPVALHYNKNTVYDEIYVNNISPDCSENSRSNKAMGIYETISYNRFKFMVEQPTYAVTLKFAIPSDPKI